MSITFPLQSSTFFFLSHPQSALSRECRTLRRAALLRLFFCMIAWVHGNNTLVQAYPHTHTGIIIKLACHLSIRIVLSFSLAFVLFQDTSMSVAVPAWVHCPRQLFIACVGEKGSSSYFATNTGIEEILLDRKSDFTVVVAMPVNVRS